MDTNIKYTIELVDSFGKPMSGVIKSADSLHRKIKAVKSPVNDLGKSFDMLNTRLRRYELQRNESFRTDHIRKYNRMIAKTRKEIGKLEKKTGTCGTKSNALFGRLKGIIGLTGGIYALSRAFGGMVRAGSASLDAAAQVETYMVTLQTLLGSTLTAKTRMAEYIRIAEKTPFELSEVVEAGNKLQTLQRYSKETLTMLGDLAAASGKPFEQVMNAYANMVSGQRGDSVRMFRDLLIANNDWVKATGKELDKMTTGEMEKALPVIMKQKKFFGMMAEQAKTAKGQISNLSDAFFQLQNVIGEKMQPAQKRLISGLTGIVEKLKAWYEVPIENKLKAESINIKVLYDELKDLNTKD